MEELRGCLLYGTSGCGKTLIANTMGRKLKGVTEFIALDATQFWGKYVVLLFCSNQFGFPNWLLIIYSESLKVMAFALQLNSTENKHSFSCFDCSQSILYIPG